MKFGQRASSQDTDLGYLAYGKVGRDGSTKGTWATRMQVRMAGSIENERDGIIMARGSSGSRPRGL